MSKVYIFGHQRPDTDAVTAAITLSHSFLKKYDFLGHAILEVKVGLKYKRG